MAEWKSDKVAAFHWACTSQPATMQCEQFEKMMTLLSQVARPRLFTCIACPQVIVADKSFHKTDSPVCLPYNIIFSHIIADSPDTVLQFTMWRSLDAKLCNQTFCRLRPPPSLPRLLHMQCMQCNVLSSTHCMCWPTKLNPSSSSLVRFTRPRDVSAQAAPIRPAAVLVKYWAWATEGKAAAVLVDN